ncbi:MAG TPA: ferritin-like domain-containing protein [Cryptosporangiaceae bacterium]|nr:ferritin-like domain-containing protein [Cryptosporangiaceae bacterium]
MSVDDRSLNALIEESQDLQVDALRGIKETMPALAEIREERRGKPVDLDEIKRFNAGRRQVLAKMGLGAGAASAGLIAGGFGGMFAGLLATPAHADEALDIQILQTAASLEKLAVGTYEKALTLPFIKNGNPVVVKFAQTTMMQHNEHKNAFQAQTTALGGKPQDEPNPVYADVVAKATPGLKAPIDVVKLAAQLEEVATETYLVNLTMFQDMKSKEIMGSVMGVEAQHLATLRAVGALLEANAPNLIKIPLGADLAKLPAAAGSVAFPNALPETSSETVAKPESGAVK